MRAWGIVAVGVVAVALSGSAAGNVAQTTPRGTKELRCRGGDSLRFRADAVRGRGGEPAATIAMALVFAPADTAAGADAQGLKAGTCSWIDRRLTETEAAEVHFTTAAFAQRGQGEIDVSAEAAARYPDVQSIPRYLADPSHYWSFFVQSTYRGYLDAPAHRFWTADPIAAAAWKVVATISGGMTAAHTSVTVTADGGVVFDSPALGLLCRARLPREELQALDTLIKQARPASWQAKYTLPANPNGCCDMPASSLMLEGQSDAQQRRSHETQWFLDSGKLVPADAEKLFTAAYAARGVCLAPPAAKKDRP